MAMNAIQKNKKSFDYEQDILICPSCGKRLEQDEINFTMSGIKCPRCQGIYETREWLDNDDTDI